MSIFVFFTITTNIEFHTSASSFKILIWQPYLYTKSILPLSIIEQKQRGYPSIFFKFVLSILNKKIDRIFVGCGHSKVSKS